MKWAVRGSSLLFAGMMLVTLVAVAMFSSENCGSSASVTAPGAGTKTAAQVVRYLVSQGLSPDAAAGVTGNLQQESGLNPRESGGGLAQWNPGWYAKMSAYAAAQGLSPSSIAGQLDYLVYDLTRSYTGLLAQMNAATSPGQAARMFETGYELCSGVTGYMQVTPGSLCEDQNRQTFAMAALQAAGEVSSGSTAVPVSFATGPACAATVNAAGYTNPYAHTQNGRPNRVDMGSDYDGTGEIDSFGEAKITFAGTGIGGGWTCATSINGGVVYELLDGAYAGKYIYVAEDVIPAVHTGQIVAAGQKIADFPSNGCDEMGWEAPSTAGAAVEPLAETLPGFSGDQSPQAIACGDSISRFLHSVGAKPSIRMGAGVSVTAVPMPAGYP
ncbi:MAG: phage tail tip lysozyme [Solirubrobacteraceae bacterium]